jgi:hypothetical protein
VPGSRVKTRRGVLQLTGKLFYREALQAYI